MVGRIVLGISGLVAVAVGALVVGRQRHARRIDRVRRAVAVRGEDGSFHREDLAGLPDVARRFLGGAIAHGTRIPRSVCLEMDGAIGLRPGATKMPFVADQVLSTRGLVWAARVGDGWMRIVGDDHWLDGRGAMAWFLWGLVPVVRAGGPDVSRSAAGRVALEIAVMLPSALLPQAGARWEAVDERSAHVSIEVGGETFRPRLAFDAAGRLAEIEMSRWDADAGHGAPGFVPWRAEVGEHATFDGITIPTRLHVTKRWGTPDADTFFEARIRSASFS